jgi:NitT/TauT family transport system substrate-binding protein
MSLLDLARLGRSASALAVGWLIVSAAPALSQTALKFSLDGKLEGPAAIFLVPQDKGYYQHESIDVTIDEGATPEEPITRVASGAYDMGFTDINALIKYRDQHPSASPKAIFIIYNKPPFAIVARKSRGITEPKNLEGKKLGAPPGSATLAQWPLFAKLNDVDVSKVSLENIALPVRAPMLAAGQLDAALGYSFRVYVDLKDRGVPVDDIVLLQMANYGLKLYGSTVIVNSKFATDKPEAVKGFLHAFTKGLKETIRSPSAAVDSVLKREDAIKKEVELERLRMSIRDNIVTPEVRANGLGAVDRERLEESINQIGITFAYKAKPKADEVFDASFLPPAAERRVN